MRMRTKTLEQTARFRRSQLTRDTVFVLLTMGVLALILATLEWVGERMRPPTSLEAHAKTIKTVAIPRAIERAPLPSTYPNAALHRARIGRRRVYGDWQSGSSDFQVRVGL